MDHLVVPRFEDPPILLHLGGLGLKFDVRDGLLGGEIVLAVHLDRGEDQGAGLQALLLALNFLLVVELGGDQGRELPVAIWVDVERASELYRVDLFGLLLLGLGDVLED